MLKIIYRYLTKQIIRSTIPITAILVFIFLCHVLMEWLNKDISNQFTGHILFHLVAIQGVILTSWLIPLGLFIAMLLVYGRLHANSEMTAIFACGFSPKRLIMFTCYFAIIMALLTAVVTLWLSPILNKNIKTLLTNVYTNALIGQTLPGEFKSLANQHFVYYVEHKKTNKTMANIFFANKPKSSHLNQSAKQANSKPLNQNTPTNSWQILLAKTAEQMTIKQQPFIVMDHGYYYTGQVGEKNYQIIHYKTYGQRIPIPSPRDIQGPSLMSTSQLWHNVDKRNDNTSELQWRIAIPIATWLLAMLAVPLSHINPRYGRLSQLIPASLIAIIYINMLLISRSWLRNGKIPAFIGLWWVHLILLILVIYLTYRWLNWRTTH